MKTRLLLSTLTFLLSFSVSAQNDSLSIGGNIFTSLYYVNGVVVNKKTFRKTLKQEPIAKKKWQQASWLDAGSGVLMTSGFLLLVSIDSDPSNPPYWWQWAGGAGGIAAGIGVGILASHMKLKAVKQFNKNSLSLSTGSNGLKLSLTL